jgi:hypothetical protein
MSFLKGVAIGFWILAAAWIGIVLLFQMSGGETGRGAFAGFAFLPAIPLMAFALLFTLIWAIARRISR